MRVPVEDIASLGVIKDLSDYKLEPGAWTDARNVRFQDGKVLKFTGHRRTMDPPTVPPYWLLPTITVNNVPVWLIAGLTKVYLFDGSHSDITRSGGPYTGTIDSLWNGGVLGGIPILNNGADVPQKWDPPVTGTLLADLPNWPGTWRAKVVRPFRNWLIALDVTEASNRFPWRMRVSHPADPGAIPPSWDDTDPTKDALKRDIGDTSSGRLVDCLSLGTANILYKESATWVMTFTGGQQKFSTVELFPSIGLMDDHCVCAFDQGRRHFLMSGDDVLVHDGQTIESVVDGKTRRALLRMIDTDNFHHSFAVANQEEKENWFCFPETGRTWPNLALVHNWRSGSVTFRDIEDASFIARGRPPATSSDTWDADTEAWDADATAWDEGQPRSTARQLVQSSPTMTKLLHLDQTEQFDGANMVSFVERTGLDLAGVDQFGRPQRDPEVFKLLNDVWLRGTGTVQVQVAEQQIARGPITWSAPKTVTMQGTVKANIMPISGKLFGIRIQHSDDSSWVLEGYDLDVVPLGQY